MKTIFPTMLIALAILLTSCGQNPTLQVSNTVATTPSRSKHHSQQAVYAVKMRPQSPVKPAFKTTSSTLPLQLPSVSECVRCASDDPETVSVAATAYIDDLPHNLIEDKGDYLVFKPLWHDAYYDNIEDVAYCIYHLDLDGYGGDSTIGFSWAENGPPRFTSKYWIALSDWNKQSWVWFEGPLDNVLTLDTISTYTDSYGEMLMTIAMIHRENVVVLREITIGAPEQRGTGFETDDIEISERYPPLYVEPMPAAVDLSADCAPVNDQGTWGSCTCFAVGDGAYNYELNALYGGLGWDLDDPFNRVSPKYLYVESGKQQGFPPGGDYGRYTDQVAIGLISHGVATEFNAPYDLVYNDAWTAEAIADAQLLKTSAYLGLPCSTTAGIETIKGVLAHLSRPVVVSTQLDYDFFFYEPGTVWDYVGPSYGGHAMLIVGYDDNRQAFKVRNSWSTDWGDNGHLWMSYQTLMSPWNWYVQCGYLRDDFDLAVVQRFLGVSTPLKPPDEVSATDGEAGSAIAIFWNKVEDATGYEIYRDVQTNLLATVGDIGAYVDETVSDSLAHTYWVVATKGALSSAFSAPDLGFIAQRPEIISIVPAGGAEGQQVRFVPEVYGDPGMTFNWSFGSGASPGTSDQIAPTVVLRDEGTYQASLTVSNDSGQDVYEWDLIVAHNEPPTCYVFSPQTTGAVPFDATLDGDSSYDVDGYIVLYEWDWEGDGEYDFVNTESVVTHVYTEPGQYHPRLRIMDDAGQQDTDESYIQADPENFPPEAAFTADPTFGEPPLDVHFDGTASSDSDGNIVLWEWDLDGDGSFEQSGAALSEVDHQYAIAGSYQPVLKVTDNGGESDEYAGLIRVGYAMMDGWEYHIIRAWETGTWGPLDATLIAGRPAVAVNHSGTDSLEYLQSNIAEPIQQSDWELSTVVATGGVPDIDCLGLADLLSKPVISYHSGCLSLARLGMTEWSIVDVDETEDIGRSSAIAVIDDKPVVAYLDYDSYPECVYYARATTSTPASSSDWVIVAVDVTDEPGVSAEIDLIVIGGIPYISYGKRDPPPEGLFRQWLARATTATPTLETDWHLHKVDPTKNSGKYTTIVELDGRPAIAYYIADGPIQLRFAWADSATPASTDDWSIMVVEEEDSPGKPSLAVVGGVPMISYYTTTDGLGLTIAKASSANPLSSDDWSLQRLVQNYHASYRNVLIEVAGKPVILCTDPENRKLYYITESE